MLLDVLLFYGLIGKDINTNINCFVHQDKNPSMSINYEKDYYYCHACGAYGNHIDAICEIEGVNMLKALEIRRKIKENTHVSNFKRDNQIVFKPAVSFADGIRNAKFYYNKSIMTDWHIETHDYLFKRGFTADTLNKHGVRTTYDHRYKVVIPIYENGHFRGYVKRRTDGMDTQRKYLFNEGFKVSKIICGNYTRDWVVITEGSLDWLKLQQNGFPNSCAILKCRPSSWQLKKLMKMTDRVVSALDNSETGDEGTKILEQHFKHVIRFPFSYTAKDCGDMDEREMLMAKAQLRERVKKYL